MHHGTCVAHVLWCIPGSLSSGFLWSSCGEFIPGIPGACATRNLAYLVRSPFMQKRTANKLGHQCSICILTFLHSEDKLGDKTDQKGHEELPLELAPKSIKDHVHQQIYNNLRPMMFCRLLKCDFARPPQTRRDTLKTFTKEPHTFLT